MKYIVFDTETTIKNVGDEAVGDFSGEPYHPDNRAVYFGAKGDVGGYKMYDMRQPHQPAFFMETGFLVGQKIKFDLAYLRKHWPVEYMAWVRNGGRIWCTKLAEYLITAQQSKNISLDKLSEKYGGTLKDNRMKEYWDAGICTSQIPEDEILPYLEQDVLNTELVFSKQVQLVRQYGMVKLVLSQMDALLCTAEMQWNGMRFDKPNALGEAHKLREREQEIRSTLSYQLDVLTEGRIEEPNPMSNDHVSWALFGGIVFAQEYVPLYNDDRTPVLFKSGEKKGQHRTKKTDVPYSIQGFGLAADPKKETAKAGVYQVGDDVLRKLLTKNKKNEPLQTFINGVLELRAITKDLTTYFIGLSDVCWHDGYIRGEHNHCTTVTGRLSSSKPNMQNISNKERDD